MDSTDQTSDDAEIDRLVKAEQIATLYKKSSAPLFAAVVNAAIVVGVLWGQSSSAKLSGWFLAIVAITLLRRALVGAKSSERLASRLSPSHWRTAFTATAALSGAVWGASGLLFYFPAAPEYQVFLVFVLGGNAAGAATSYATHLPTVFAFVAPSLAPILARMAVDGDRLHIAMTVMLLLFGGVVTLIARSGHVQFVAATALRFRNERLVQRLRERSELELERYRALVDAGGEGVVVAKLDSLEVVDANDNARRLLGEEHPLHKRKLTELSALRFAEATSWPGLLEARREGEPLVKTVRVNGSAERVTHLDLCLSVRSFQGQAYVLIAIRDVSEQRALEGQLAHKSLLESVGELAAGVAHEINNPLSYVLSNLRLVERALESGKPLANRGELSTALSESVQGAEQIRTIVRDLTVLSRSESDELGPVELEPVLRSVLNVVSLELKHRATLVQNIELLPRVMGDAGRLKQVFMNLMFNAVQAIDRGSPRDNTVTLSAYSTGSTVVVKVTDTGVGIAEENLSRIFEPFFTTKPVGSGTGLGLSICHSLLSMMGATLNVESQLGKGSAFTVTLRAASSVNVESSTPATSSDESAGSPGEVPVPAPTGAVASTASAQRARVLVIDDDRLVARGVKRALADHDVEIAESGREGLDRLLGDEVFDIVICDVMMPDMNGMTVFERLRSVKPGWERRLIFLTGGAVTDDAKRFLRVVDNPCTQKPFDTDALDALVRSRMQALGPARAIALRPALQLR